jgi:DNA mismatch repair ATPase MutS
MAELQRLKMIVDRGRQLDADSGPMMFYLLDEILQGTNTSERHVAVTRVIGHLLDCRAVGAVSTHDLELAAAEELQNRCQLVHLRETIQTGPEGDTMTFDYVVRPGVTPTTNALKLLDLVGLGTASTHKNKAREHDSG